MSNPIAYQILFLKLTPENLPSGYALSSATSAKILYRNSQQEDGEVTATINLPSNLVEAEIPETKTTEGNFIYHVQLFYPLSKVLILEAKKTNLVPKFKVL